MSDSWNLYEQHIHFHDKCFLIDGGEGRMPVMVHPEFYNGEDIDILRQKLIEKCDKQIKTIMEDDTFMTPIKTAMMFYPKQMIDFIYNVFGVDE